MISSREFSLELWMRISFRIDYKLQKLIILLIIFKEQMLVWIFDLSIIMIKRLERFIPINLHQH